jgi:PAS domain S-box-containing protein
LKGSEVRFRTLFESSRDAIMTLEPPEWKFTSGNPSTVQMFRAKDEAEFTSHGPGTVSPELQPDGRNSAEKAKEMIEAAMRDGSSFFEWTHKRLDGEDFPASVLLTRMERDGAMILQATVRDITEQKKILEELEIQRWGLSKTNESIRILYKELEEKNEELKRFNELKSTFVANVAHEVRNPLAIVRGAFDLIEKILGGQITDKQKQVIEMGTKTIDRLARLVTDLLDLSKIETGKMHLKLDKVDMPSLAEEILLPYDIEFLKKNMALEKNISPDSGTLMADRDKLSQVIINLLNNAIKYTPDNGTVALTLTGSEDEVRCEISDNGPGIPEDEREKIFDKFERVTAEKQAGTGLGLAIAKDIVTLHKGKLWVESEAGKGSKFIFTLPRT